MKTELQPGEKIVRQGPANLQKNVETVGGWLFLTTSRLVFEAHSLNFQGGITEIDLADVSRVEKCWTKFLGLLPLLPNSLAVQTRAGNDFRFVLYSRDTWAVAIQAAIAI
jgi:hypothetical protein